MPEIIVRKVFPKRQPVIDGKIFIDEIRTAINRDVKPGVLADFEKTVEGWEHRVSFEARLDIRRDRLALRVFPTGPNKEQYLLVNRGARPHVIRPKRRGGKLLFQPGYSAATTPGKITSRAKVRSGAFIDPRVVNHPGFKGRDFFETIGELHKLEFKRQIENALRRGARRHMK